MHFLARHAEFVARKGKPRSIVTDRGTNLVKTHPDKNGLVRTVTVSYRRRDRREKPTDYKKKPLVEENVAVQRLSVLLSAKEQLDV